MERPRWGNRCTGKKKYIFILRGEKMCGDFLKGQAVPTEGARRGRAGGEAAEPGPAAGRRLCPGNALSGPAAGTPGPGLTCSSRDAKRAGVGDAAKTKVAAGAGAAAAPGRGERRRGGRAGRSPAAGPGLRRLGGCVPGRACWAWETRGGACACAPGSLPGCKFLVSGF